MLQDLSELRTEQVGPASAGRDRGLQAILWSLWTLAVVGAAYMRWRADLGANHPVDLLGLVIYALLVGSIGLVVLTLIEIRLEPRRFSD
jgi:hypothetical protein